MQEGEKLPLPELRIPVLKQGDSLDLSFSFQAEEPMTRIWAYLEAESVHPTSGTLLRVERFSVEISEQSTGHPFRINRLLVASGKSAQ